MECLKGKKLLILAGNDVHTKVVNAAKELGIYTIVTDYLPVEDSPAKSIADEYWNLSTNDVDKVVEKCRQEHVDGVINFCIDTVQKAYPLICEKLGVPYFASSELFDIFTNKRKFKSYCRRFGVDVIPEYTEDDIANDNVKYPILIKPSDSRGSRGITICHTKAEVEQALAIAKSESSDNCALIERYMGGAQDIAFAYMVIGGTPYLLKMGDRILGYAEDGLQCQQMAAILPSLKVEEYKKNVEPNVIAMIKGTGMQFGVVFMQGFWEDGHVYMYDPGLRFPGSDFNIVTKEVTGFDSMKSFAEYAVTGNTNACYGDPSEAYNYAGGICMILAISCKPGRIDKFSGFDVIEKHPAVFSARQIYKEKDTVPNTHDVRQRVAEFIVYTKSREEAKAFVDFTYQNLCILNEQGEDMIISKVVL